MLKSLSIKNYALINNLKIDFDSGFSIVTGETGAGKSIILGALSLILGERADTGHIRDNEKKCIIEGLVNITKYNLKSFFEEKEWDYDGDECILRREIWSNGKSRAFVNDSPVYLNDLKELGGKLIDIHSQHNNILLNDNLFQLKVVDLLSGSLSQKESYTSSYKLYKKTERELQELFAISDANKKEVDYIKFQHQQLSEANILPGEQLELESELSTLSHSEEIKSALFNISENLSNEGFGIESQLKKSIDSAQAILLNYKKAEEFVERLHSAYIDMKDLRMECSRAFEEIEFNPTRQEYVEGRLATLYDLQKKHGVASADELIPILASLEEKLNSIESLDEQIEAKEKEYKKIEEEIISRAKELTSIRKKAIPFIEKELSSKLSFVGIPNSLFICEQEPKQYDATGGDSIRFLFSANKNTTPQPVSKIASGGEISRLMLCIKSMIAGTTSLPCIIFDEIDTGTSGEVADKIGTIMQELGDNMQVIAITHLPQIAVKGDTHYFVYKEIENETTKTSIKRLKEEERVRELAKMLSGTETTIEAIENAKALLKTSSRKRDKQKQNIF